jgi:hypothetical protein
MQINMKTNVKAIIKNSNKISKKDLPKAFGKAIDEAAESTAKLLNYSTQRYFNNPVKQTQQSFGFWKTNFNQTTLNEKRSYVGLKGVGHIKGGGGADRIARRVEQFSLMVFGGTRTAKNKYLVKPAKHSKLNDYGNFPKTFVKGAINNKKKYFTGIPKGLKGEKYRGVWEKTKDGNKMVAKFDPRTTYTRKIFPYLMIVKRNVTKVVEREFKKNIRKYYLKKYYPPVK